MLLAIQDLKGAGAQALDGSVGRVEDFLFDDQSWAVRYLVVNTGGWLSGRKVLLSPIAIQGVGNTGAIVQFNLTREQIQKSPDIDADQSVSRSMEMRYFDYYRWPYYWAGPATWGMAPYPSGILSGPRAMEAVVPSPPPSEDALHLRSARSVRGYHIAATDDRFGNVEDFAIDTQSWEIRYLVIDTVNYWPSKSVLISPAWVEGISWSNQDIRVGHTKDQVRQSPEYIAGTTINRAYEEELYDYYGRPRYWDGEPARRSRTG